MPKQSNTANVFTEPNEIERIAVFRALQLGDMLCAIPVLRSLRKAFQRASVTLIALPWAERFTARYSSYIDGFLPFPGHPALPEMPAQIDRWPAFLHSVCAREFDVVFQLHGSGEITNPLVALFGAGETAGFYREGSWKPGTEYFPYPDDRHEILRLLALVEFLGFEPVSPDLEFPLLPQDEMEAEGIVNQFALDAVVCIHAGARAPSRRWPAENFARVADALTANGYHIVLTGTLEERPLAMTICELMKYSCINLAGKTSIGGLAALLKRSQLLVCNDTGVSHLASALQMPTVVVFSGSDPQRWAPLNRNLHRACTPDGAGPVAAETVIRQALSALRNSTYAA